MALREAAHASAGSLRVLHGAAAAQLQRLLDAASQCADEPRLCWPPRCHLQCGARMQLTRLEGTMCHQRSMPEHPMCHTCTRDFAAQVDGSSLASSPLRELGLRACSLATCSSTPLLFMRKPLCRRMCALPCPNFAPARRSPARATRAWECAARAGTALTWTCAHQRALLPTRLASPRPPPPAGRCAEQSI